MGKIYTIVSGKGGVGKTTTAVNLGAALNSFKEDVIVVDANLTTPNLGLYLGAPVVPVSLNHVLKGKAKVDEAIYEHESGTKVIPASLSIKEVRGINHKKLHDVAKRLRKISDHIIFDSAAGLGTEASAAIEAGDEVIVVTSPDMLSVTDALKTIKVAEEHNKDVRGVIISRVRGDKTEVRLRSIKDMLEVPILGVVPEDKAVRQALANKNAVIYTAPKSKAARAYNRIAAKLVGRKVKKKASFYERVLRALGL